MPNRRTTAAGLLILRRTPTPAVLLVYQVDRTFSIPKGRIEPGETAKQAALRETWEEIGLQIHPRRLASKHRMARVIFWRVDVHPADRMPGSLPRHQLQAEEVLWAGFVPVVNALQALPPWQVAGMASALESAGLL